MKNSCEDEDRCRGVLRCSDGVASALFSGPFKVIDSLAIEVGAISIALDRFLELGWKDKSGNKLAFTLAVADVKRQDLFKAWWRLNGLSGWVLAVIFSGFSLNCCTSIKPKLSWVRGWFITGFWRKQRDLGRIKFHL
ncbi:hypothetical protein PVK06_021581 [Gossypium arboreum]|uniref:Uncharacterized protein n=1 Tax=Gossypium arboreum TaxID=29729 RepID=A0ABR0PQD3_GOSAR|nr:hypothetical protein PVK06_021581 [Gossypium arboreum]